MVLRFFRLFAFIALAALAGQAWSSKDVAVALYERWDHLPSEQLMKMGERYRTVTRRPDSALVCFSIVANRYYQNHRSHDDIQKAIEAMTHMSWLYKGEFYDYAKAVNYNMQAKELAEKYQCFDYMPFILINNADLISNSEYFTKDIKFSEDALKIYKQAFEMAFKHQNWHAMHVAFFDMMIHTTFANKESLIEHEMNIMMSDAVPDTITNTQFARCLIAGVRAWNSGLADSSLVYFKHLLDIAEQQWKPSQKRISKITANYYISFWYLAHDRLPEAIEMQHEIIRLSKDDHNVTSLLSAYNNLSHFHAALGDSVLAQRYHILFLEGKDELVNKKKLGSANEARFLFELDKKNEKVREMAHREQVKSRVMWGALITAVCLLTLLILLLLNYRRVQERNRQLYQKSLEMLRADEEKRELIERLQLSMSAAEQPESPYAPVETVQREGKLSEARQTDLLHRVFLVMETSDEIFSPDFSLPRLAELVGDTRNNVSEAINLRYHDNFNGLLNEYRIKEACRRINNPAQWGGLTLEAIGQSVGFKSRSTFWTAFKQCTGLTPGAYQRQRD